MKFSNYDDDNICYYYYGKKIINWVNNISIKIKLMIFF